MIVNYLRSSMKAVLAALLVLSTLQSSTTGFTGFGCCPNAMAVVAFQQLHMQFAVVRRPFPSRPSSSLSSLGVHASHNVARATNSGLTGSVNIHAPENFVSKENECVDGNRGHNVNVADLTRRDFGIRFFVAAATITALTSSPTNAAESSSTTSMKLQPYNDSEYGFRLLVPSTWETSEQKLSGRRKAVFFVDPAPSSKSDGSNNFDTLLFIAYTPIRDDFTSLASFGSVDQVAQATILPRGALTPGMEDNQSKMIEAISGNRGGFNAYCFDYVTTPVVPNENVSVGKVNPLTVQLDPLHFRTIFTLLPLKDSSTSAGLTLVTITMQTPQEKYDSMKRVFDEIVGSFGKE